ncbi:hypothetical protein [Novispirillum itersonii]|uniref:hypothetical protein n=1 Tax=Novispirillum itersonii TaxID=189 RepID=UPI000372C5C8|nr:hypothetical protein [Novispirillum itersonii]
MSAAPQSPKPPLRHPVRHHLAALALTALLVGVLAGDAAPSPVLTGLAATGLFVYAVTSLPDMSLKAQSFVLLSVALAGVTALLIPDAAETVLRRATAGAAFVAALYASLGFLRDAAETSPLVRRCGQWLAAQPPGRRYVALASGSHLFGIILNFGVIPLLGAIVRSGVGDDDSPRGQLRLRRMMSAVHRGFSLILPWSPLTVSLAVVLTALPSVTWEHLAPWALGTAAGFMVIGWLADMALRPPPGQRQQHWPGSGEPWTVLLPVVGLVILIFSVGGLWSAVSGSRLVVAVMTATPLIGCGWILTQALSPLHPLPQALRQTSVRMRQHGIRFFPGYRNEIALLSSAAFIGACISALIPAEVVAATLRGLPVPPSVLIVVSAWLVVACGQIGMNPVLSVTLLTGILPPPEVMGVHPVALAVALTGAWSLTAASSPFSAAPMVTATLSGTTAGVVGRRWNGPYTLAALVFLSVWVLLTDRLAG